MKATKFLVAACAAMAIIGFASCSDSEQDVNVVSDVSTHTYTQYYTATGTITETTISEGFGSTDTYSKDVDVYTARTSEVRAASIQWTENRYSNKTDFTISIPVVKKTTSYSSKTDTTGTTTNGSSVTTESVTVSKIGSKYYASNLSSYDSDGITTYPQVEVTIDPKADTVTLSWTESVSYYYDDNYVPTGTKPTNGTTESNTVAYNVTLTKLK